MKMKIMMLIWVILLVHFHLRNCSGENAKGGNRQRVPIEQLRAPVDHSGQLLTRLEN